MIAWSRGPQLVHIDRNPRGGDARPAATRPRRLLYVFAGPERPTDGVRAIAAQLGFEVDAR